MGKDKSKKKNQMPDLQLICLFRKCNMRRKGSQCHEHLECVTWPLQHTDTVSHRFRIPDRHQATSLVFINKKLFEYYKPRVRVSLLRTWANVAIFWLCEIPSRFGARRRRSNQSFSGDMSYSTPSFEVILLASTSTGSRQLPMPLYPSLSSCDKRCEVA